VHATIVVPTRDRPRRLRACVDALAAQDATFAYEVVVVDDAREPLARLDGAAAVVASHGAGPAAARNAGVEAASGSFVCLIDDDCVAPPSWLRLMVTRAETADGAVVAGPTVNGQSGSALAEASQQIVTWLSEVTRSGAGEPPFAPTSNICCRREILQEVPFDPAFPRAAADDRDWCARLEAAGHPLVFEKAAPVYHYALPGLGDYLQRHFRYGAGARSYRRRHGRKARPQPAASYALLLRRSFAAGNRVGAATLLAQAATAIGYAVAALRRE
jgi:glycosyltransferase involved in cell wall biosynthesis